MESKIPNIVLLHLTTDLRRRVKNGQGHADNKSGEVGKTRLLEHGEAACAG